MHLGSGGVGGLSACLPSLMSLFPTCIILCVVFPRSLLPNFLSFFAMASSVATWPLSSKCPFLLAVFTQYHSISG
ncbi:hypothetical protein CGRA01v4_09241 [Colletotrichum graminicola]|nr:hypothetical protein CGRA01v4_09241 [Colletotrichum graminicola]